MLYVNKMKLSVLIGAVMALSACSDKSGDISILSDSDTFYQSSSVNNKIDILWMVDTSASMQPYQTNLANNFNAFITDFVTKGYDYHMAVGGTDAWHREKTNYNGNSTHYYGNSSTCATEAEITAFRDGDIYGNLSTCGTQSGTYLITSLMNPATIISTFATNIKVGIYSDGDERGFQSIRGVLRRNEDGSKGYGNETHTALNSFRRNDAFLAVIIVADEEDGSRKKNGNSYSSMSDYRNSFINFLDGYTNSAAGNRKYNVSSIVMIDKNSCPNAHSGASNGNRYIDIANSTDGIVGDICDTNFSENLKEISGRIAELSTRFQLSREPIPSSIQVFVNDVSIPQNASNGWIYVADSGFHFIEFRGSAVPPQGAAIRIDFDPVSLQ
jgi:hypothetical protein